jgi:hypothetical protein
MAIDDMEEVIDCLWENSLAQVRLVQVRSDELTAGLLAARDYDGAPSIAVNRLKNSSNTRG